MKWMVVNQAQLYNMFGSLGSHHGESYVVGQDCHSILDEILKRLSIEDRTLRTFRRAIGFSQVIRKDLLPLLINVKDDRQITDTTIKILVNLTMPVECLLPLEVMSKTDAGRNTIMELNWLLANCKEAFLDPRATRRVVDHIRALLDYGDKLSIIDCNSLNNCVVLLRNVLHIPEMRPGGFSPPSPQNQLMWNLFAQNIDKILIELMSGKQRSEWGMAMVQLIALLYKDQYVTTLQKLLNLWFELSLSESSEDNESNTSPPERGSGDSSSSSMVTSDPTSDSSDNSGKGGGAGGNGGAGCGGGMSGTSGGPNFRKSSESSGGLKGHQQQKKFQAQSRKQASKQSSKKQEPPYPQANDNKQCGDVGGVSVGGHFGTTSVIARSAEKMECGGSSEVSDCGYGTQMENQESISTSSNEDESPNTRGKPVHQKPANLLQKSRHPNGKVPSAVNNYDKTDLRRKKLVKRSRTNSMNMKALLHHAPTDEDISHLLKEFTVDFLLKGYGCLVEELRRQLLFNSKAYAYMDTSHFFWLVTYFLKFATQLELDLEHISSVLSFDVVSYLTFEGVNLCEQFELAKLRSDCDMTPCLRRMHLVVTAIRELVQAVDTYKKVNHLNKDDLVHISTLQRQMCETEDLRCLFVLLLRQFTPTLQSKQYLQDIIVTNHMLLSFIETTAPSSFSTTLHSHMRQFVAVDMMRQYGLLLECFEENGQFVNDCIFTMMHHVAGDLENVAALFQPAILNTFSVIWESDFQVCDDWLDLIEYVIHKFINMPRGLAAVEDKDQAGDNGGGDNDVKSLSAVTSNIHQATCQNATTARGHEWSQEECDSLYWYYVQSANSRDPVGGVLSLYAESGITNKTRIGVIEQILEQDVITRAQYNELMEKEPISNVTKKQTETQDRQEREVVDEIEILREHLVKEDKLIFLVWVQKTLLEACHAKLNLKNSGKQIIEPVAYYCTLLQESIPVIAWNCDQCSMMQYQPFVLLLHKLGLNLPAGAGKVYARIPHFWSPLTLYNLARKLGPVEPGWMKFDPVDIENFKDKCSEDVNIEKAKQTNETEGYGISECNDESNNCVIRYGRSDVEGVVGSTVCRHKEAQHSFANATQYSPAYITYTPEPNNVTNWLEMAERSKFTVSTDELFKPSVAM